ncbi:MAG: MFS transporter, partial [Bdellovibrionota bacterium]
MVNPKLPELLSDHVRLALDSGISASLMYLGIFAASFLYGRLADRGNTFRLLAGGLFLYSAVLFLFRLAGSKEAVFLLRLFEGLGLSAIYVSADVVLCRASRDDERGRWLSYYGVALSLGLLCGPITVLGVQQLRAGSALAPTLAALAALVFLFGCLSLRLRLPPAAEEPAAPRLRKSAAFAAVL